MIARIWHGRTRSEDFEAYTAFMKSKAIPDYRKTDGFQRLTFLRRLEGDVAHFMLVTFWADMDSIKNFAGDAVETAKYYPEDNDYLLEFEEKVIHYEVFAEEAAS